MMLKLYEQWLSSGEDWMRSDLVINSQRSMACRRRGKHVMKSFKSLRELHGLAVAKGLRDAKKEQQQSKLPTDMNTYWMENPDLPGKEDPSL